MGVLSYYLPILCLLVFREDLRYRAVHWSLLAQAFLCFGVAGLLTQGRRQLLEELPMNLLFLALQFGGVTLYCCLKERRWVNLFARHMGLGDLLFLLACAPLFPRHLYALFVLTGTVFSLAGFGVIRLAMPQQVKTVPTAGLLALYLSGWFTLQAFGVLDLNDLNELLAHG